MHRIVTKALMVTGMLLVGLAPCLGQEERRPEPQGEEGVRGRGRREGMERREGPGGWGGRFRGRGEFRLPDELREFLEDFAPGELQELQQLRLRDTNRFRQALGSILQRKRRLDELKETDPEAYERHRNKAQLEHQAREIATQIREAHDEEAKAAAKEKLCEIVSQLFDIQCEERVQEIEELTKRAEELRQMLEIRQSAKEKIVERRVSDLTGDGDHLRWDTEGHPRQREPQARGQERPERGPWGLGPPRR